MALRHLRSICSTCARGKAPAIRSQPFWRAFSTAAGEHIAYGKPSGSVNDVVVETSVGAAEAAASERERSENGGNGVSGGGGIDLPFIPRAQWVDPVQRIRNKGVYRQGTVVRTRMDKTAVVHVTRLKFFSKLKFMRTWSSDYFAHDEYNECGIGDKVLLRQCRPISKKKAWYVQQILHRAEKL